MSTLPIKWIKDKEDGRFFPFTHEDAVIDENGTSIPDKYATTEFVLSAISKVNVTTSTDNAIVRFDGTDGDMLNSGVTISDNNEVTATRFVGPATKSLSVPIATPDSTSTSTAFTVQIPEFAGETQLRDGLFFYLFNNVVAAASGYTLNVNGLGAKPVWTVSNARSTTGLTLNKMFPIWYNSSLNSGNGAWVYGLLSDTDTNTNTLGYLIRGNNGTLPMSDRMYRYRIYFTSADGSLWVPSATATSTNATTARNVNQRPINPFGPIGVYGSTGNFSLGSTGPATTGYQLYAFSLGYAFNPAGGTLALTVNAPIYVKCSPQANGSAIIDATTPYTQSLPTTEDGYIYIFLGIAYSATLIELRIEHPVYYYKNGGIRIWNGEINDDIDYSKRYLTFEALEAGSLYFYKNPELGTDYIESVSYSVDNGKTWTTWTNDDNNTEWRYEIQIEQGDKILFKGLAVAYDDENDRPSGPYSQTMFNVYGNIMSMLYGDDFIGQTTLINNSTFYEFFGEDVKLGCNVIYAENLILPATTLTNSCYAGMFGYCTNLITAPSILPATTLVTNCYTSMFTDCSSLTTAPQLPATTLANRCYQYMFEGCESLITAPELPATILEQGCYGGMFRNCTSIITAPQLPATTLADNCYQDMFYGCDIEIAPELPATTLAVRCYQYMFNNCTRLITAPELPATTLITGCYQGMFQGCINLEYIKCLATNRNANLCLDDWVKNVALNGTFIKNNLATNWSTGNSGIPTLWNIYSETDYQVVRQYELGRNIVIILDSLNASSAITTLYVEPKKYYRIPVAVNSLSILLASVTNTSHTESAIIMLKTDANPNITFTAYNNIPILMQSGFDILANTTYELNCLFNGAAWMIGMTAFRNL